MTYARVARSVSASALLCAAVLTACSDEDPGAGPSGQTASPTVASSSASTPSVSTSEPTDTSDPSDPSDPTSSAAGGPVVELRDFTIQAPEGWTVYNQTKDFQVVFNDDASNGGLIFVDNPAAFPGETLESLARSALQRAQALSHGGERVANRSVDGLEGYVIVGSTKTYEKFYEWGAPMGDNQVSVGFEWVIAPENAEETIEAVLASIQFK